MTTKPLRLIVVARHPSERVRSAYAKLREFLQDRSDVEVVAASVAGQPESQATVPADADLVVVLGGDGAILRACRQLGRQQLPILGINLGKLGFLADLSPEQFFDAWDRIVAREYVIVEHLMFDCTLTRADGESETWLGLNEAAIRSGSSLSMLHIHLRIDDEDVTTYSCDGLIVSTPVGSTAHSLSAGGPILRQDLNGFVVTPICAHTLSNRPIVDSVDRVYTLTMPDVPKGVQLVIDGQIRKPFGKGDQVQVTGSQTKFQLARLEGVTFYSTLHRKLGWGGQPQYQSGS